ncbi:MAG: hypothetical protein PHT60_05880 [Acidiphilium sp.]|nr:hypothetical protein [Acidiphilium sp.]MDD4935294.1 hypothetical protein [Acidiphilium sp.]
MTLRVAAVVLTAGRLSRSSRSASVNKLVVRLKDGRSLVADVTMDHDGIPHDFDAEPAFAVLKDFA